MKPGFENAIDKELKQKKKPLDTDLDGEIYADQLHSLLQRITPEAHTMIALDAFNKSQSRRAEKENIVAPPEPATRKLTDEEKIWNQIYNNGDEENNNKAPIRRNFVQRIPHNNGAFEGVVGGPVLLYRRSCHSQWFCYCFHNCLFNLCRRVFPCSCLQ